MLIKQIFMAFFGLSAGMLVSGGVFTVFVSVGLVPRFAGKTHTGNKELLYENSICAGTIAGCLISIFGLGYQLNLPALAVVPLLAVFGIFAGMFIGCFAIAIAEMLNTIPIFGRRVGFRHGLGVAILSIAIGKAAGSLFYFSQQIFLTGGQ